MVGILIACHINGDKAKLKETFIKELEKVWALELNEHAGVGI